MDLLAQLKIANKKRQDDWVRNKPLGNIKEWDLPRWGNAVAGETGEMCNIIKKIDRGDLNLSEDRHKEILADEVADVVCYLDLLCQHAGIDLRSAIVSKFNKKSQELGSDITLTDNL